MYYVFRALIIIIWFDNSYDMPKFREPVPRIDAIGQCIVTWRQSIFWTQIIIIIIIIIIWSDLATCAAAFMPGYITGERDLPIFRR